MLAVHFIQPPHCTDLICSCIFSDLRTFPTDLSSNLRVDLGIADTTVVSQASTSNSSVDDSRQIQMDVQKFELGTGSKPVTVMSYEIWKEHCAARKKAELRTRTNPEQTHQQPRKRSFDEFKQKDLQSLKRTTRSPPVLSPPHSLAVNNSSSIESKTETVNRFANDEYRRVTLPTIPPVTVLVRHDGSAVLDSIAPLPVTTDRESALSAKAITQAPSEPLSTPKTTVSTATTLLIRTPIAVNHVPSCDVKLSSTSVDEVSSGAASNIVSSSPSVFSTVVHRPSPNIPNNHNLLKLPLSLASPHPVAAAPSSLASPMAPTADSLSALSLRVPQATADHDDITEAQALTILLPTTVPPHSNAVFLAQHQQRQQAVQQLPLLPNAGVGCLIGPSPLQTVSELVGPIVSHGCLVPPLAASGAPPVSTVEEQNASLLRQLHRQQQLQQQVGSTNLLTSNDLLSVYQLLADPLTSQALQAQLKELEHSGSLFTQSVAT